MRISDWSSDVCSSDLIYNHVILVLKGVSLQVPKGGIVALLGANGAGKTTTLKVISNLLRAERGDITKGHIDYHGERIDQLNPSTVVRKRSEEHTSELQSLMRISYAVFCLKKKTYRQITKILTIDYHTQT